MTVKNTFFGLFIIFYNFFSDDNSDNSDEQDDNGDEAGLEEEDELEDEFDDYGNPFQQPPPAAAGLNTRIITTVPAKEPVYNAVPLKSALKKPKGSGGHSVHNGQAVQLPSSSKSNSDPPTTSRYVYNKGFIQLELLQSINIWRCPVSAYVRLNKWMYQRPNFKAMLTRYVENGIKSKIKQFFWVCLFKLKWKRSFFFQKIIDCNYSKKEEKVGHNTLGWISIELLIRSILRIFFSFFNNVTEIVEGVYF